MKTETVKVGIETTGFDEAQEKVNVLMDALERVPPQVILRGNHDCEIYIHPSQMIHFDDDDSEIVKQLVKGMMKMCVMNFGGDWEAFDEWMKREEEE